MSGVISDTMREVTPRLDDGRYEIVSVVRDGRLYLAERAGKRFILKTAAGAKGLEMLKREYELSAGLAHPSLAYVFTWEEDSPVGPCLVQEFVDGRTLAQWLAEKPSVRERRRILGELLSVVGYLHRKGVIHNDLTPGNIVITRAGNALKLIDLGFADDDTHLEKALGGTRGYASPELIAGAAVDARSDIYSIGALMRDIFPGRYGCIVRRCMRQESGRRYASVEALERALGRRRMPVYVAAAAVVACILAWPFFRKPSVVEVPVEMRSDSLRAIVDSLRQVIAGREEADALLERALSEAKAKVDRWYCTEVPAFRKALAAASSQNDVNAAWQALTEKMHVLNYDIPDSAPAAARPAVREYIMERQNRTLPLLQQEMASRVNELIVP